VASKYDAFSQMLENYKKAVYEKDVNAFVKAYDRDPHVFDMWGAWFGSLGDEQVVVDATEIETTQSDDMAIGHAILTFTAFSASGEKLRSMNNRLTVALKKTGDEWRVIHEHTSVPINVQTMKPELQYSKPS
jgi:ketosteroid isomerase-like protein